MRTLFDDWSADERADIDATRAARRALQDRADRGDTTAKAVLNLLTRTPDKVQHGPTSGRVSPPPVDVDTDAERTTYLEHPFWTTVDDIRPHWTDRADHATHKVVDITHRADNGPRRAPSSVSTADGPSLAVGLHLEADYLEAEGYPHAAQSYRRAAADIMAIDVLMGADTVGPVERMVNLSADPIGSGRVTWTRETGPGPVRIDSPSARRAARAIVRAARRRGWTGADGLASALDTADADRAAARRAARRAAARAAESAGRAATTSADRQARRRAEDAIVAAAAAVAESGQWPERVHQSARRADKAAAAAMVVGIMAGADPAAVLDRAAAVARYRRAAGIRAAGRELVARVERAERRAERRAAD